MPSSAYARSQISRVARSGGCRPAKMPILPTGKLRQVRQVRKNTRFLTKLPNLPTGKLRQVRKNTRFLTNMPNVPNLPTPKGRNLPTTKNGEKYDAILPIGHGDPGGRPTPWHRREPYGAVIRYRPRQANSGRNEACIPSPTNAVWL